VQKRDRGECESLRTVTEYEREGEVSRQHGEEGTRHGEGFGRRLELAQVGEVISESQRV
jgi:hypothetical protein